MTIWYTHINRNKIDANRKHGTDEPVVRYQRGKHGKGHYCHAVALPEGSRVVYKATGEPILPCGARLVIISDREPLELTDGFEGFA